MDHLPQVNDPYAPLDIPYLGGRQYDCLNFSGYPTRQKWQINRLVNGDLQGRTDTEAAQFLQTWLYFGMLHEALQLDEDDRIDLNGFVRTDAKSQKKFITTHQLPELLHKWRLRVKERQDVKAYYERFRDCMNISCNMWRDLMEASAKNITPNTPRSLLGHEILLSIQILGAALDVGISETCGSRADYVWRVIPESRWLMQRMIGQGWCPTIVTQLSRPCATFLYYASLLGPPRPGDDHKNCSRDSRACRAADIREGEQDVAKHVDEGCQCEHIAIHTEDKSPVANAITQGDIPVIHLVDDGTEPITDIRVYKDSNRFEYTAISHV